MAGKKKRGGGGEGEHENSERWLLTYADMITLLVAFFIMLYSMSVMNQAKFQQLAISVRSGFGQSAIGGAPTVFSHGGGANGTPAIINSSKSFPSNEDFIKDAKVRQDADGLDKAYTAVKAYIQTKGLKDAMHVVRNERGVVVTVMTDKMLFAPGQADLRPTELALLNTVGDVIRQAVPLNPVRVEGHTDSLPIHTLRFPSNWELSTTRATTVLRYFEARGVGPQRLEAGGYADQRPITTNDTDVHRAQNRRVEIVILRRY